MSEYIPDLTERFPEGFGGVNLTPSFYGGEVDWSRAYQETLHDDKLTIPYTFHKGTQTTTYSWFTGGCMVYKVKDLTDTTVMFDVVDHELDGTWKRVEEYDIQIDNDGEEYVVIGGYKGDEHRIYAKECE